MTSLPPGAPKPRLCRVRKDYPEQDYGFNLHADRTKGQYIGAVDGGSPASVAGLKTGDRIVAVNGSAVGGETHKQVVARIKEHVLECQLLVIDEAGEAWYRERKVPVPILIHQADDDDVDASTTEDDDDEDQLKFKLDQKRRENGGGPTTIKINGNDNGQATAQKEVLGVASKQHEMRPIMRPRLCRLAKQSVEVEFGFNLHAEKNVGHFIGKVDPGSVAERAGLERGQRIVGANGVLIYQNTPNRDVVEIIKRDPMKTDLLVVFPEVDEWYKTNGHTFSFEDAEIVQPPMVVMRQRSSSTDDQQPMENGKVNNGGVNKHQQPAVPVEGNTNGSWKDEKARYSPPPAVTIAVPQRRPVEREADQHERRPAQKEKPLAGAREDSKSNHWSGLENGATAAPHSTQQDWMNLSAAELRERVGRHKKTDPRTQQLSLLQKYEIIHNL